MATTQQYAVTPNFGTPAALTTADTSLTAPSTVSTILTAGSSGSRIDSIDIVGVATTTACIVNIFAYDGSTYHLLTQVPILANTVSTTAPGVEYHLGSYSNPTLFPIILKTGWSLRATITVTQTGVKVIARGGDF